MYRNEECWILKGRRGSWWWNAKFDRYTIGLPARVAFDYDYVLQDDSKVIGWIHTHPTWRSFPSATDDATMKQWVTCLGRPLLCCIIGTDKLRAWWYYDDERAAVEGSVQMVGRRVFGCIPRMVRNIERAKRKELTYHGNSKVCS
jgi:hypothetical protein